MRWQNHTGRGLGSDWAGLKVAIGFVVTSSQAKREMTPLLVQECLCGWDSGRPAEQRSGGAGSLKSYAVADSNMNCHLTGIN